MRKTINKAIFGALLLIGGVALSGSSQGKDATQPEFEALYPKPAAAPTNTVAGIDVGAIGVSGLTLKFREDETPEDRGVVLSFTDGAGEVRAVIRFAVTPTSSDARSFLDRELHGVARVLPEVRDATLGDLAYADDGVGNVYVAATVANVAYVVRVIPNANDVGAVPSAKIISADLRTKIVAGTPVFPKPAVAIPSKFSAKDGAPIALGTISGQSAPHLRGENAYVAHGTSAPILRPFAPGRVALIAIAIDDFGRVGVTRVEATAK